MRKITLLAMLLFSVATFSQSKSELQNLSGHSKMQSKLVGMSGMDTEQKAFIGYRMSTLGKNVGITFEGDRKPEAMKMFAMQYEKIEPIYQKYKESKSDGAKVDLIRAIIENEEELRAFLTPDEKVTYLRYGDKADDVTFEDNFLSDDLLAKFKKAVE